MSDQSTIEWTDATWNPVRGCTKVSPGCKNCYAETFAERWRGIPGHPYEQGFDLRLVPEKLDEPLRWHKPKKVFVNSMSDLFHEGVPDEFIDQVFAVMGACEDAERGHLFQVLTKRAERMETYTRTRAHRAWNLRRLGREAFPPRNVWLGVSVEDQQRADERVPHLLRTPAVVRFLSCEPLLGPVDLSAWMRPVERHPSRMSAAALEAGAIEEGGSNLHWVIVGGESGPGSRPCNLEWLRSIVQQCRAAGVQPFVKQAGARPDQEDEPEDWPGRAKRMTPVMVRALKIAHGGRYPLKLRDRKGGTLAELPEDLRIREYPKC